MLKHINTHLATLGLTELKSVHRSVCNSIKAAHDKRKTKMAAKFSEGSIVLHCGRKVQVQAVMKTHILVDGGAMVPMSQCRQIK